jgi:hypothetical protein
MEIAVSGGGDSAPRMPPCAPAGSTVADTDGDVIDVHSESGATWKEEEWFISASSNGWLQSAVGFGFGA